MNKNNLRILISAYSASIFSQGILSPIYAFFVLKIGGGILETAYSTALFSIVTGIVTILIYRTKWSRKYEKECLVWGWFLWTASLLMYCCITSIIALCISQVLNALGNAFSQAAFDVEYAKVTHSDPAHGWSWFEGATNITSGIASLFTGILALYFGLQFLMICMSIFATISFLIIYYYSYVKKI